MPWAGPEKDERQKKRKEKKKAKIMTPIRYKINMTII